MLSKSNRRKPASSQKSTAPETPQHFVFVYSSDKATAGFCFERYQGVTKPVASFTIDSQQAGELANELAKIGAANPIERVFVPPNRDGDDSKNVLLENIPNEYKKQAAPNRLNFADCLAQRSIAIARGSLVENGYEQATKLQAAIARTDDAAKASAWLWSYVLGAAVVAPYRAIQPGDFWSPGADSESRKY